MGPVSGAEHGAAAGRDHPAVIRCERIDDGFFDVPKTIFALALEELTDRTTQLLFDHVVGIREGHTHSACQLPPDGGLAASGHTDKSNHLHENNFEPGVTLINSHVTRSVPRTYKIP